MIAIFHQGKYLRAGLDVFRVQAKLIRLQSHQIRLEFCNTLSSKTNIQQASQFNMRPASRASKSVSESRQGSTHPFPANPASTTLTSKLCCHLLLLHLGVNKAHHSKPPAAAELCVSLGSNKVRAQTQSLLTELCRCNQQLYRLLCWLVHKNLAEGVCLCSCMVMGVVCDKKAQNFYMDSRNMTKLYRNFKQTFQHNTFRNSRTG